MSQLYRVLKPLSTGQDRGALVAGEVFKPGILAALLKVKALKEAQGPPLSELPGWSRRAERLAEIGVLNVADLLRADPERIQGLFRHKRASTATGWQTEATRWLKIDEKKKKSG